MRWSTHGVPDVNGTLGNETLAFRPDGSSVSVKPLRGVHVGAGARSRPSGRFPYGRLKLNGIWGVRRTPATAEPG